MPEADKLYLGDREQARLRELATTSGWTQADVDGEVTNLLAERRATHEALTTELNAHPELGGDKKAVAQQDIARALDFALPKDSAERQRYDADLSRLALTNYPPLALALTRLGRLLSEDGRGGGAAATATGAPGTGGATKTDVEVLFGATTPK